MIDYLDQINALVAEHVMGWTRNAAGSWLNANGWPETGEAPRRYSTDIAQAWKVLEKFESGRIRKSGDWWYASVYPPDAGDPVSVQEDSAPLAICLAALTALGVELPAQ